MSLSYQSQPSQSLVSHSHMKLYIQEQGEWCLVFLFTAFYLR